MPTIAPQDRANRDIGMRGQATLQHDSGAKADTDAGPVLRSTPRAGVGSLDDYAPTSRTTTTHASQNPPSSERVMGRSSLLSRIVRSVRGLRSDWHDWPRLRETVASSQHFNPSKEDVKQAASEHIFTSGKQRNYLFATSERLYVVLDDLTKEDPVLLQSWSKEELIRDGKPRLDIRTWQRTGGAGSFVIGGRRISILFTKSWFGPSSENGSIEDAIAQMVRQKML